MTPRRRDSPAPRKSSDSKKPKREGRVSAVAKHPFSLTVAGALIAAWLVPAFAQQWQDRQRERELKRDIATELDRNSTSTVIAMRVLIDRRFPEAQTAEARLADLRKSAPSERARALVAFQAAQERERDTRARTYIDFFSDWLVNRSVMRSTLEAQFSTELADSWQVFADNVTWYVRLAGTVDLTDRRDYLDALTDYLGGPPKGVSWDQLAKSPDLVPRRDKRDYAYANATLANSLLLRKTEIVEDLLAAHAAGYSTRTRDLINNLLPFAG